jgi:hypothetical protein
MREIRDRLSYSNVTASLALFLALAGTSYAVATLPRNSVGSAQLRPDSVGASEVQRRAVRSSEINDRSIRLRDISKRARESLRGQVGPVGPQGPPGPTFSATIRSSGGIVKGNVTGSASSGLGVRLIAFPRSMANCVPSATLTAVPGGPSPTPPGDAGIRTETSSDGRVVVRTFNPNGAPQFYPFNLIVAC